MRVKNAEQNMRSFNIVIIMHTSFDNVQTDQAVIVWEAVVL